MVPGGGSTLLRFDGDGALSNAVHVESGETLVGVAAWQRADVEPAGLVPCPLRTTSVPPRPAGVEVDPAELVAATLRRVAGDAAGLAGGPVEDVRMVVPAGWGPRRRTWWRRVAGKAGLAQVRLVEAPVAAAERLAQDMIDETVVRWLVVDVGAGCEVSVVRRTPNAGFELLSTLADDGLGGDQIDAALAEIVLGTAVDEVPIEQRWAVLSSVRAGKHALAQQPAVTVVVPGKPPVVVSSALLRQAAQPVFEQVGVLAAQAVQNADMTVNELDAVFAVGATMQAPGAAEMIAATLGTVPVVPQQPGTVAVLGAADAGPSPSGEPPPAGWGSGVPPLRRLVGLGLPGALSLLLYAHFVFSAQFNNGVPGRPRPYYYVLASWGELTMSATLALLTCLQAAALIDAVLYAPAAAGTPPSWTHAGTISSGIGVAAVAGAAIATLYGVTAAVFFAKPVDGLLRWATVPLLPTVVSALVLAMIAWRRQPPVGGWDAILAFPASSIVAAAVGTFAVAVWGLGPLPAWLNGWTQAFGYGGGLLVGAALACTLTGHRMVRIALTPFLGFFCAILSQSGLGILAVIYALTVAAWWGYRAWTVFRTGRPVVVG